MDVGVFGMVLIVALAVIAAAAIISAVGLLAVTTLAVSAPAIAGLVAPLRRRRWREWHPPTDWLPDPDDTDTPTPVGPDRWPMRAVTLVSALDVGAQVRLITAQVPSVQPGRRPVYAAATLVHAKLEPGARLALPADPGCDVLVYVLAGQGRVGADRTPVCGGQLAVLEPEAPFVVASNGVSSGLEVLALGQLPQHHPVARGESIVTRRATTVDRRLQALRVVAGLHSGWSEPLPGTHPAVRDARHVRAPQPEVPRPRHAASASVESLSAPDVVTSDR